MHSRLTIILCLLIPLAVTSSCSSLDKGGSAATEDLPSVRGSARRPVDSLPRTEYPFDEDGNYVESWAAEGDRRFASERSSSSSSSRSLFSSSRRSSSSSSRSSSSSSRSSSSRTSSSSSSRSSTRRHVVKSGDTLWGLSRRYGTSVAAIKKANRLSSDTIRNGQSLVIP